MLDVCHDDESQRPQLEALLISYDGLLVPMGSSQVLPYVEALADDGVRTRVLSFETASDLDDASRRRELRDRLDARGIEWIPLRYHKRPRVAGTLWDVVVGAVTAIRMARARPVHIVHARSYLPGLIGCSLNFSSARASSSTCGASGPKSASRWGSFVPKGCSIALPSDVSGFFSASRITSWC